MKELCWWSWKRLESKGLLAQPIAGKAGSHSKGRCRPIVGAGVAGDAGNAQFQNFTNACTTTPSNSHCSVHKALG